MPSASSSYSSEDVSVVSGSDGCLNRSTRRCGAGCFTCSQRLGDCMAQVCQQISPKSIPAAKQCTVCSIIMLLLAVGFIVQAFLIPTYLHKELVSGLQTAVLLDDPSADQFAKWVQQPEPLVLTTYVYDIKNVDEILLGAAPVVVEMGPYVYKQYSKNYNWTYGSDAEHLGDGSRRVIGFRTYTWYEFDAASSVGTDMANLTTVNMPFSSVRAAYETLHDLRSLASLFTLYEKYQGSTEAQRMFINRTVHETLFGWIDPVIHNIVGKKHGQDYRGYLKNFDSFEAAYADYFTPQQMNVIYTGAEDTFPKIRNYLWWHNDSAIATCSQHLPADQCDLVDQIVAWNNNSVPSLTGGAPIYAGDLRGNDGSVFPTPINELSTPTTFFTPLLRSIDLEYKKPSTYKGVPLLQFGFPSKFFKNSKEYSPNAAYYQDGPSGLLNMTAVQGLIPLYVSNPRFAGCDPALTAAIDPTWLGPTDPAQVPGTIYEVEPQSGVTFHVSTTSQVNLFLSPLPKMPHAPYGVNDTSTWFADLKPVYLPVMWAKAEGGIDDHDAGIITSVLLLIRISQIGGLTIGILLAVLAVVYLFLSWRTYEIESERHLSAVRSLLSTDFDQSTSGVNTHHDDLHASGSLLDSSVLVMQEDEYATPKRAHRGEDIDISYTTSGKHGSKANGSYQQQMDD